MGVCLSFQSYFKLDHLATKKITSIRQNRAGVYYSLDAHLIKENSRISAHFLNGVTLLPTKSWHVQIYLQIKWLLRPCTWHPDCATMSKVKVKPTGYRSAHHFIYESHLKGTQVWHMLIRDNTVLLATHKLNSQCNTHCFFCVTQGWAGMSHTCLYFPTLSLHFGRYSFPIPQGRRLSCPRMFTHLGIDHTWCRAISVTCVLYCHCHRTKWWPKETTSHKPATILPQSFRPSRHLKVGTFHLPQLLSFLFLHRLQLRRIVRFCIIRLDVIRHCANHKLVLFFHLQYL